MVEKSMAELEVLAALKALADASDRLATARQALQHEKDLAQYDRMVAANKSPNKG